jgi:hypothetical protein
VIDLFVTKRADNLKLLRPRIVRKKDGRMDFKNVTSINISNSADIDRIAGMLMGKRAAISEVMDTINSLCKLNSGDPLVFPVITQVADMMESSFCTSTSSSRLEEGGSRNLLLKISVQGGITRAKSSSFNFYFICPYGKEWNKPGKFIFHIMRRRGDIFDSGLDISMFAQSISADSPSPPPSVLKASPLTRLILVFFI